MGVRTCWVVKVPNRAVNTEGIGGPRTRTSHRGSKPGGRTGSMEVAIGGGRADRLGNGAKRWIEVCLS